MATKTDAPRYRLRIVLLIALLIVGLVIIPALWIASNAREYRDELVAVERIRKILPDSVIRFQFQGPAWMERLGFNPPWLTRVDGFDATGTLLGSKPFVPGQMTLDFDDTDFAAIKDDLKQFRHLDYLSLKWTKLTDESMPLLRELTSVGFINLRETAITSDAVKQLKRDMPNTGFARAPDEALRKTTSPVY